MTKIVDKSFGPSKEKLKIYLRQEQQLTRNLNAQNVVLSKAFKEHSQRYKTLAYKSNKKVAYVQKKLRKTEAKHVKLRLNYNKLLRPHCKSKTPNATSDLIDHESQSALNYMLDLYALWSIPFAELHKQYMQPQKSLALKQHFENALLKIDRANLLDNAKEHKGKYDDLLNTIVKRDLLISDAILS